MWLMTTNPVSQLLGRAVSRVCFFFTDPSGPWTVAQKSMHRWVGSVSLPEGLPGTLPEAAAPSTPRSSHRGPCWPPHTTARVTFQRPKPHPQNHYHAGQSRQSMRNRQKAHWENGPQTVQNSSPLKQISKQPSGVICLHHRRGKKQREPCGDTCGDRVRVVPGTSTRGLSVVTAVANW